MARRGYVCKFRIGEFKFSLYQRANKGDRRVAGLKELVAALEPFLVDAIVSEEKGMTRIEARRYLLEWLLQFGGEEPFSTVELPLRMWFTLLVRMAIRGYRLGEKRAPRKGRSRKRRLVESA